MAENIFGNSQFSLNNIASEEAKQIGKHRAIIEQKEKGEDMAKTVGETKLFMSAHGIQNSLKPLKPRIKKLIGRKTSEFKKKASNTLSDYLDGDGGKSRRLNEFKDSQDKLNEDLSYPTAKKRFQALNDEDRDSVRESLKNNPEYTGKEDLDAEPDFNDVDNLEDFRAEDKKTRAKFNDLDDDTKDKIKKDLDNDDDVKSPAEIKAIEDPEEQLEERVNRSSAINDKMNELSGSGDKESQMKNNTKLLREAVSDKETSNFLEKETTQAETDATAAEGKAARFKAFKDSQDAANEGATKSSLNSRISNLPEEDRVSTARKINYDPEYKTNDQISRMQDFEARNAPTGSTPKSELAQNTNNEIAKREISSVEEKNFVANDADEAGAEGAESTTLTDVASSAKSAISNFVQSGKEALAKGVNGLNKESISNAIKNTIGGATEEASTTASLAKGALKAEAKSMAESTLAEGAIGDTAAGVASAALDAVPGADIFGALLGAGIAIKKAIQVKKLERKDEGLVADEPVVGSVQTVGL